MTLLSDILYSKYKKVYNFYGEVITTYWDSERGFNFKYTLTWPGVIALSGFAKDTITEPMLLNVRVQSTVKIR